MSDIIMNHPTGTPIATIQKDAMLELETHFKALVEVDQRLGLEDTELGQIHKEKLDGVRTTLLNDFGISEDSE
jgi:hypothetical protein